jgi:hypothetical protein
MLELIARINGGAKATGIFDEYRAGAKNKKRADRVIEMARNIR